METLFFSPQWEDVAAEKPRFVGVAYSGGLVPAFGKHGDSVVDLSGFDQANVIILSNHSEKVGNIVGTGRIWKSADQTLLVEGELTRATDDGRTIAKLLEEGIHVPLSIGFTAEADVGRKGRSVVINNRELHAKTIFRSPRFREVSFVPVGADPLAQAAKLAALEAEMANQDELELQIDDLKAKLATAEDRAVKAEARALDFEKLLKDIQFKARKQAVEELHAKLNRPCTETAMAMFQSLNEEQFGLVRDSMLALKPAEAPHQVVNAVKADVLQAEAALQKPEQKSSLANIFELAYKKRAM